MAAQRGHDGMGELTRAAEHALFWIASNLEVRFERKQVAPDLAFGGRCFQNVLRMQRRYCFDRAAAVRDFAPFAANFHDSVVGRQQLFGAGPAQQ